ncbi:hypothetical protein SAMN05216357_10918 [Porphyromonadaceae bacterium KH3CP3RA]|nr:hypothetical protein SAMN05216357_10918 [Porphyromonadaceae bacterium KH3CP3RA]
MAQKDHQPIYPVENEEDGYQQTEGSSGIARIIALYNHLNI